jgi:hypothetical protein
MCGATLSPNFGDLYLLRQSGAARVAWTHDPQETPQERSAALAAENAALRARAVRALLRRVQEMEARLAKESHPGQEAAHGSGLRARAT